MIQSTEKKILEAVYRTDWESFVARGGHPVLMMDIICVANSYYIKKVLGLPNLTYWLRSGETSFFKKQELDRIKNHISIQFTRQPRSIEMLIHKLERIGEKSIAWASKVATTNWATQTDQQLERFLDLYLRHSYPLWTSAYFPMITDMAVRDWFKVSGPADYVSLLSKYAQPRHLTDLQKKHNALVKIRRRYAARPPKKILDALAKRYAWSRSYVMLVRPYGRQEVLKDLASARTPIFVNHSKLPAYLQTLTLRFEVASMLTEFRDRRLSYLTKYYFLLAPFLSEFARRRGLTYTLICQAFVHELQGDLPSKTELLRRSQGAGFVVIKGKPAIVATTSLNRITHRVSKNQSSITGRVAYPGLVRGRVRRVNPYNYQTIKPGEVVVTAMTTPEIVSYLKRAAAIVTDEGGITVHAAIVARELKLPCIIGTKIATEVLKDGDMVEVDATNGVVKRI